LAFRIDGPAAAAPNARLGWIDAARGVAILAMAVYHFSWDLRFFGYISADVAGDPGWRIFARLIAGSFLFLVGVSLVLSARNGFNKARFLRRLATVTGAAAAITVVTWFVFPDSFIFFGILHCIALSSVLGLAFLRAPLLLAIGAAILCFLAPSFLSGPVFDHRALLWLGLATYFPRTNDYVPILPWFGVVLAGVAAARLAPVLRPGLAGPDRGAPAALAWAGRHSLPIYLIHQPLLFGLVYLAALVVPPEPISFTAWHGGACTRQCTDARMEEGTCRGICGCLTREAEAAGLGDALLGNSLTEAQTARYFGLAEECRARNGE
jgi:uncharacterized membrane protein